jgi:hypothetical protein
VAAPQPAVAPTPAPAEPSAPTQPPPDLPPAVDLPALEPTAAAAVPAPCELGRVVVPEGATLTVALLGGLTAGPRGTTFQLDPAPVPATTRWQFACLRTTGGDPAPVAVAELTHVDQRLMFTWLDAATRQDSATCLRNCVLRISCGAHTHDLRLRRPERVEPLQVNLKKPDVTLRVKIPAPPDPACLRFQVTSLVAPWPQPCALNPAEPVAVGSGQVCINLGDEAEPDILSLTLAAHYKAVFELTCDATFRLQANAELAPCTAKKLQEAEQWVNQHQTNANAVAQQIRAVVSALPPSDPLRPVREAELRQAELQLADCTKRTQRMQWLNRTRDLVEQGAPIHFRVFYLADGCEVNLLYSDPAAFP